jgi:hypothetical protein
MNNQLAVYLHIFNWSFGFAVPWTFGPFAPRPSIGSRFFCLCSSSVSPATPFARKHSTVSRPPAQVRSSNSLHSSQVGTWVGSSEGTWVFQSVASIFPVVGETLDMPCRILHTGNICTVGISEIRMGQRIVHYHLFALVR